MHHCQLCDNWICILQPEPPNVPPEWVMFTSTHRSVNSFMIMELVSLSTTLCSMTVGCGPRKCTADCVCCWQVMPLVQLLEVDLNSKYVLLTWLGNHPRCQHGVLNLALVVHPDNGAEMRNASIGGWTWQSGSTAQVKLLDCVATVILSVLSMSQCMHQSGCSAEDLSRHKS